MGRGSAGGERIAVRVAPQTQSGPGRSPTLPHLVMTGGYPLDSTQYAAAFVRELLARVSRALTRGDVSALLILAPERGWPDVRPVNLGMSWAYPEGLGDDLDALGMDLAIRSNVMLMEIAGGVSMPDAHRAAVGMLVDDLAHLPTDALRLLATAYHLWDHHVRVVRRRPALDDIAAKMRRWAGERIPHVRALAALEMLARLGYLEPTPSP